MCMILYTILWFYIIYTVRAWETRRPSLADGSRRGAIGIRSVLESWARQQAGPGSGCWRVRKGRDPAGPEIEDQGISGSFAPGREGGNTYTRLTRTMADARVNGGRQSLGAS